LVDDLYKYEVNTKTWTILKESGFARYLHSAVLINGAMLIFGGNTHNDTSLSNGAKCFSADFLAYDIACDEWKILPKPNLHRDVNRFGHSAVVINGSMYIFGGFSSVLLNDILVYKPPNCKAFRDEELCKNAGLSRRTPLVPKVEDPVGLLLFWSLCSLRVLEGSSVGLDNLKEFHRRPKVLLI